MLMKQALLNGASLLIGLVIALPAVARDAAPPRMS